MSRRRIVWKPSSDLEVIGADRQRSQNVDARVAACGVVIQAIGLIGRSNPRPKHRGSARVGNIAGNGGGIHLAIGCALNHSRTPRNETV